MKVLGITGGVGAGKSTVLLYLQERHGAVLLSSDEIARELRPPGMIVSMRSPHSSERAS